MGLWASPPAWLLRRRDVLERLAEIGLGGSGKAVGSVAQKDLVHVDLENLVFGQQVLQLEGQQDFVDLAGIGFFRRQVDIACHLHGDGGCALAFDSSQIGKCGTSDALVIDPAMFIKTRVFNGQNGILHDLAECPESVSGADALRQTRQSARLRTKKLSMEVWAGSQKGPKYRAGSETPWPTK
jgi:hypothetical protein